MKNKTQYATVVSHLFSCAFLEFFSKWSEISDVLLLMRHFVVEVIPNVRGFLTLHQLFL